MSGQISKPPLPPKPSHLATDVVPTTPEPSKLPPSCNKPESSAVKATIATLNDHKKPADKKSVRALSNIGAADKIQEIVANSSDDAGGAVRYLQNVQALQQQKRHPRPRRTHSQPGLCRVRQRVASFEEASVAGKDAGSTLTRKPFRSTSTSEPNENKFHPRISLQNHPSLRVPKLARIESLNESITSVSDDDDIVNTKVVFSRMQSTPVETKADVSANCSTSVEPISATGVPSPPNSPQESSKSPGSPKLKYIKAYHTAAEILEMETRFYEVLVFIMKDFWQIAKTILPAEDTVTDDLQLTALISSIRMIPIMISCSCELILQLKRALEIAGAAADGGRTLHIADIFIKHGDYLKMSQSSIVKPREKWLLKLGHLCIQPDILPFSCMQYSEYIKHLNHLDIEALKKKYTGFEEVVRNLEKSPKARFLRLADFLKVPCQQIPRYVLLMKEYHKNLVKDGNMVEEAARAQVACSILANVAKRANDALITRESELRMHDLQRQLGSYEILKHGRWLRKDGPVMKYSRKELQQRHLILLSDILVVGKPVYGYSGLQVSHVVMLYKMRVTTHGDGDDMFERYFDKKCDFLLSTPRKSFIVHCQTEKEQTAWVTELRKAIHDAIQKRIEAESSDSPRNSAVYNSKRNSTGASSSSTSNSSPTQSILVTSSQEMVANNTEQLIASYQNGLKFAPFWIPDERVTSCMICNLEFSLFNRRHHCRECGRICCAAHAPLSKVTSSTTTPLSSFFPPAGFTSGTTNSSISLTNSANSVIDESEIIFDDNGQATTFNAEMEKKLHSSWRVCTTCEAKKAVAGGVVSTVANGDDNSKLHRSWSSTLRQSVNSRINGSIAAGWKNDIETAIGKAQLLL